MLELELDSLPRLIGEAAEPLPNIDDPAFAAMFDRFGGARVVLLGEASHGTSEFYRARAEISRRLIERQHELVEVAQDRLSRLGYDNVRIVEGDGTRGCADEAPFDAILAAASGSHVPQPLLAQLAPGGRIVMPIGSPGWAQELVKVTKQDGGVLKQENLGGVRFVPLIGEEGWKDDA